MRIPRFLPHSNSGLLTMIYNQQFGIFLSGHTVPFEILNRAIGPKYPDFENDELLNRIESILIQFLSN